MPVGYGSVFLAWQFYLSQAPTSRPLFARCVCSSQYMLGPQYVFVIHTFMCPLGLPPLSNSTQGTCPSLYANWFRLVNVTCWITTCICLSSFSKDEGLVPYIPIILISIHLSWIKYVTLLRNIVRRPLSSKDWQPSWSFQSVSLIQRRSVDFFPKWDEMQVCNALDWWASWGTQHWLSKSR